MGQVFFIGHVQVSIGFCFLLLKWVEKIGAFSKMAERFDPFKAYVGSLDFEIKWPNVSVDILSVKIDLLIRILI